MREKQPTPVPFSAPTTDQIMGPAAAMWNPFVPVVGLVMGVGLALALISRFVRIW